MRTLTRTPLLVAVAALCVACSSASRPRTSASPALRDARIVTTGRPELQVPRQPVAEGTVADIRVEVQVDTTGRAVMNTLRVTGIGAAENREAIARWIEEAQFKPATVAGRPVPSRFRTRFEARVRRVRGD